MKTDKEWEARALEVWNEASSEDHAAAMVRLGREMADARAEEIALHFDACWRDCGVKALTYYEAAAYCRSTITKPKTREQVLEAALRALLNDPVMRGLGGGPVDTARRALEWKP